MKVCCFGDSNTYGYDPRGCFGGRYSQKSRWVDLVAAGTGWTVCNLGENGRCIPLRAVPFPADAGLVILMLGTNDLLQGLTPQAAAARMAHFVKSLALERKKILLIAPPPLTRGAWVPDEALVEASRALAGEYKTLAGQLGIAFADAGAWAIPLAYDGVHFTEAGHRAFADGLLAVLAPYLQK